MLAGVPFRTFIPKELLTSPASASLKCLFSLVSPPTLGNSFRFAFVHVCAVVLCVLAKYALLLGASMLNWHDLVCSSHLVLFVLFLTLGGYLSQSDLSYISCLETCWVGLQDGHSSRFTFFLLMPPGRESHDSWKTQVL